MSSGEHKIMPKLAKKIGGRKGTRRVRGKGAYYPGGMTLRGRGGFFQDLGNGLKKIAGPLIGAVGGVANTVFPGAGMVANGIRQLIGAGAYSPVRSNAILAQPVPRVNSTQDVGVSYSHCEFLGDVTGSTDWELTQFHVNPGLPEVFPWLSGVASNFQKYRISGLVFYIRSTSSVAISNTTDLGLGTVLGGFQTNVYDKAPASKLEFLSLSGARSGKPSEDHIYPMECDRSKNVFGNLLVRTVGVQDDLAKYDHAVFNLATVGFPGSYYLGELWVSYQLTLMAPKVEAAVPSITSRPVWGGTTWNERRFNAEKVLNYDPEQGNAWMIVPPLSDSVQVLNSAGWSTGLDEKGNPVLVVPAGTVGYFLVSSMLHIAGGQNTNEMGLDFTATDNSGSVNPDRSTWYGLDPPPVKSGSAPGSFQQLVAREMVFKIQALPDRPLKIRSYVADAAQAAGVMFSMNIVRLPDKIFASSSSAATVSLAQKVQRIALRRATAAQSGLLDEKQQTSEVFQNTARLGEGLESLSTAPPDLLRQRIGVTQNLGPPSIRPQR